MKASRVKVVLEWHRKWLDGDEDDMRADFSGKDLSGLDLRGVDMSYADLRGAKLRGTKFEGSNLQRANFADADLSDADLRRANLEKAILKRAVLRGTNLEQGTNLESAYLGGADLTDAKLPDFQLPTGELIGYKKVRCGVVLTLEISEERTASLVGSKCRCRSVKVLAANVEGAEFRSIHDQNFVYRLGETITVENWSNDIRVECAPGIHFFRTYKEALDYRY